MNIIAKITIVKLIVTGRIIAKVELKSYPINKNKGVPNNNKPTPKID